MPAKSHRETSQLDKVTSAVMYYFISSLNGVLGRTHLQKLLFLSDLLASRKFGQPITKMKYVRYTHGPYSKSLDDYIEGLTSSELIEERRFPILTGPEKYYSRFYQNKMSNVKDFLVQNIGPEKMLLVDEVSQSYGNKSLQDVLSFVYSLEEVKNVKFDSPIKMAQEIRPVEEELDDDIPF